jgi:hypothetical protein
MDSSFESTLLCTQNQGQNFFVLWAHRRILKERELWVMLVWFFNLFHCILRLNILWFFAFRLAWFKYLSGAVVSFYEISLGELVYIGFSMSGEPSS